MKTETMEIIYVDAQGMEERLRSLSVPEGMEVQLHPISAGETELAAAFQAATEQSEAKYKIYISSDSELAAAARRRPRCQAQGTARRCRSRAVRDGAGAGQLFSRNAVRRSLAQRHLAGRALSRCLRMP